MHKPEWNRPRTSRAYLQPPLAERICLVWPDMKLISASLPDNGAHLNQPAIGVILLQGNEMEPFEYRNTVFELPEPGVPLYRMKNQSGALETELEAFCDMERNPAIFFQVHLRNSSSGSVCQCLGVLPRSGMDSYLTCQHQEGYGVYDPNVKTWYMLKRTWKQTGEYTAEDNGGYLRLWVPDSIRCHFVRNSPNGHTFAAADYFQLEINLNAGEEISFAGVLACREISRNTLFADVRERTCREWREQLKTLRILPDTDDPQVQAAYRHLAAQLLQMLARYEGSDLVTPRQGDLGRLVWPYEATIFLSVLDHIGLRKYTADAYRYILQRLLQREGEDRGRIGGANSWDNYTGATIWGLACHLEENRNEAELREFLPDLLEMTEWIERKRHSGKNGISGIFPAGKGSDWPDIAQFWTLTDSYNAMGERKLAEVLALYNRPEAETVKKASEDYRRVLEGIRDELYKGHESDDAYILPHELGVPFEDTLMYSYYCDGAPILLLTGFMDPNSNMRKQMENYFRERGQFDRGLTGRMTNCNLGWDSAFFSGYGDVWYTQQSEYYWIRAWMEAGEKEKAWETLCAMMRYGMTKEYIVSERYCSFEPWYSPWQPNASGSARMMQSMLAFFGEKSAGND